MYRFLGGPQRVDLGAENFANTARWAKLGGDAGAVYQYLGAAGTLNLSAQDYADTTPLAAARRRRGRGLQSTWAPT